MQLEAVWLPAAVRDVLFDPGTKLVHVLGRTPDGAADTIYVVEPRANAVFADARLPATPVAWALDAQPERPSDDREELLTIAADGSLAVVDSGSNAFAWRFPGVIAGALMAGLVFLLGRLLVRRRSVALLAAGLLLVDGMAFAQARIAMNDTYVGLFIVAAYTAFAAVWLGAWRGRSAVLIGLPLVGILLGLALAAKWVGIYAIGGIVLLVLLRSALGRIAALLAMIALTGVLGWLAMSSPGSSSPDALGTSVVALFAAAVTVVVLRRMGARTMTLGAGSVFAVAVVVALVLLKGNAVFFVIMVGLTLLLAVAIVLRPVRFTLDELRFAVLAPGVAGAALGLASIAFGSSLPAEGPLGAPTLLAGGLLLIGSGIAAYLVVALAARAGLGPLAPPPEPGDPETLLEPAAPAPQGWMLPGWRWGVPWLWALVCLTAIPLAVYIVELLPLGGAGQPLDRVSAGGQRRPDVPRPPAVDVQLPQRSARDPRRVIAVVGLALRPQAGLVLPRRPRRRLDGDHLRRRQPRPLLALRARHGLDRLDRLAAAQHGAGPGGDRLRLPVAALVAHRPGDVPVPLLHDPALPRAGRGLLPGRVVARRPRRERGCWPVPAPPSRSWRRRCCGSCAPHSAPCPAWGR